MELTGKKVKQVSFYIMVLSKQKAFMVKLGA